MYFNVIIILNKYYNTICIKLKLPISCLTWLKHSCKCNKKGGFFISDGITSILSDPVNINKLYMEENVCDKPRRPT